MVTKFGELLRTLLNGVAVNVLGYGRSTVDLDVCYSRSPENIRRIVAALMPLKPTLRGAPADLPFLFDERTMQNGLNFTFDTALGELDLLGEVTGVGGYDDLAPTALRMEVFGHPVLVMSLDLLERSKAAAGRAKDLVDLEAIRVLKRKLK